MYVDLVRLIFFILILLFALIPFITILRDSFMEIFDCTLIGDIVEDIENDLEYGFDEFSEALVFVGRYLIYMIICLIMSLALAFCWPVFIPFFTIAGLLFYFKKNK